MSTGRRITAPPLRVHALARPGSAVRAATSVSARTHVRRNRARRRVAELIRLHVDELSGWDLVIRGGDGIVDIPAADLENRFDTVLAALRSAA